MSRAVQLHAKHDVLVGNVGVTTSNGYLMDNGDQIRLTLMEGEDLYAVCETGTGTLHILVSKVD